MQEMRHALWADARAMRAAMTDMIPMAVDSLTGAIPILIPTGIRTGTWTGIQTGAETGIRIGKAYPGRGWIMTAKC